MASIQEPEVQFAQRLASNEKPIRTKAIKKLRKYINVRSQKAAGGFTGDELLKLWKGLFYCLWMQDKPLLQEELSNQITSLIHSFQDVDGQFLYLESFLQTLRREWTGIDRLRMDKFFQLVRFMFRQTFEMLKRKDWDSSVVSSFLELLTAQLLQSSSGAPSGLQLHVLDLYMTELAAVGSAELTADQNLIFIEPFCKTVSKTKDRILFSGICTNIFGTIIDQAPFAIEDLMKEVNAAQASDSDSGQASDEEDDDEEEELREKTTRKPAGKKSAGKQINGNKSDEEDEDEDELLHLEEDSDTEEPCDEDIGPVLQFDYSALADRLFGLASRSGTPGRNRQRLYRIVKVLRDLSEGIFPQDEYPEEVSTDEDDDMFGSRKRMKRTGGRREEEDEDGAPASKKKKGKKKEASTLNKQDKDSAKDDSEPADLTANNENKKKKKRKKKKAAEGGESADKETGGSQTESAVSSVKVSDGSSETLLLSEVKEPSVTVTEETVDTSPSTTDDKTSEVEPEPQTPSDATVTGKKKKKKRKKAKLQTDETVAEPPAVVEEESAAVGTEESTTPETETTTPAKKKKKNAEKKLEEESQVNGVTTEEDGPKKPTDATTPGKKKSKKKSLKADEAVTVEAEAEVEVELEGKTTDAEVTSVVEEAPQEATTVPLKKKKENKREETTPAVDESIVTPLKKKKSKNNQKQSTEEVDGAAVDEPSQVEDAEILPVTMTTAEKKKKKKKNQADEITDEAEVQEVEEAEKPAKKKKRKIPVTFEYEADELEAAAAINGLAEEEEEETAVKKTKLEAAEPSTPLSSKKSQKKKKKTPSGSESDFITFQSNAAVPTPLFCKTKGSPGTPRTGKKKSQTPKSESKKVTFGLKNNKTAEFRKTDRSLLVSPDGSSRVPFDPQQKPKFGVLKSPVTRLSTRVKKTPKKTGAGSPKSTPKSAPKRRPSAADFF